MNHQKTWFVVWQPESGAPRFRHETKASAKQEARRLAGIHPGKKFHVLALIGTAIADNVQWSEPECGHDDDIPF